MDLLIATNNRSKFHEMKRILVAVPAVLRSLADLGIQYEVAETGTTFGENASLKASTYARIAKMPTLADDSGLVIDYLYGEPGVRSARFAGASSTDDQRIAKVLSQMSDAKKDERSASFVCVTTFADETGKILYLSGWVVYEDGRRHVRTTYFCREYLPMSGRFAPVDDPDCEKTY